MIYQIQGLQSQRTCKIADHYQKSTLQICTYENCEQHTRRACVDCLKKSLHKHKSLEQGYLQDQIEFVQYLEKKKKEIQEHDKQACRNIQDISQRLKSLVAEINDLIKFLYKLELSKNNNNNIQQIQQMINNVKQDFFLISDENANQIIQIKNKPFELINIFKIVLKSFQINNTIENYLIKQNIQQIQEKAVYDRKKIQLKQNYFYYSNQSQDFKQQNKLYVLEQVQNNETARQSNDQQPIGKKLNKKQQVSSSSKQVESLNKISQIQLKKPIPFAQISNPNNQKPQIERVQINTKPLIQRDMSTARSTPFQNNLQSPNQIFSVYYKNQQPCLPKK